MATIYSVVVSVPAQCLSRWIPVHEIPDGLPIAQKIGYTGAPLVQRLAQYATHNPLVRLREYITVYRKTKHQLERAIQRELEAQGYSFIKVFGIRTEWVLLTDGKPIDLDTLQACKGRKVYRAE